MSFFGKPKINNNIETYINQIEKLEKRIIALEDENKNLRAQLKFEEDLSEDGFVLTPGEYIIGTDIMPGRYSFKLMYGDSGKLETSGRNWVIVFFGTTNSFEIAEYKNLLLRNNTVLKITGNIKLFTSKLSPINIHEDISIIESQKDIIKNLEQKVRELTVENKKIKSAYNNKDLCAEYILKTGFYYGDITIASGIYDLKVISGCGYLKLHGNYFRMGFFSDNDINRISELNGVKISSKTKIEVTDNLVLKAVRKDIKL